MNTLIEKAREQIEFHQKEVTRLRDYISKIQEGCHHPNAGPREEGMYKYCEDCGRLF